MLRIKRRFTATSKSLTATGIFLFAMVSTIGTLHMVNQPDGQVANRSDITANNQDNADKNTAKLNEVAKADTDTEATEPAANLTDASNEQEQPEQRPSSPQLLASPVQPVSSATPETSPAPTQSSPEPTPPQPSEPKPSQSSEPKPQQPAHDDPAPDNPSLLDSLLSLPGKLLGQ